MNLVSQLETWKKDLEALASEKSKAEGRLEQALEDLKSLGFEDLADAKIELDRRIKLKGATEEKVNLLLEGFKVKYEKFIG
jgi:hypothetical protein